MVSAWWVTRKGHLRLPYKAAGDGLCAFIVDKDVELTFQELGLIANKIAHYLVHHFKITCGSVFGGVRSSPLIPEPSPGWNP
jgi:hypothetical protein